MWGRHNLILGMYHVHAFIVSYSHLYDVHVAKENHCKIQVRDCAHVPLHDHGVLHDLYFDEFKMNCINNMK